MKKRKQKKKNDVHVTINIILQQPTNTKDKTNNIPIILGTILTLLSIFKVIIELLV